jgi:pimeloyl-ACP methyl ester carboxylesterase
LVARPAAALELNDCTLTGSRGLATIEARCGWFERPEDPANPDSDSIRLRVAVVPSLSRTSQPDALTVINGGPGASSLDLFADAAGLFTAILRDRDVLLIDQRGTGASQPLDCPDLESVDLDFSAERVRASTRECLAALPGDPSFYTTSLAVQDLEALRRTLGYRQLNVYGISYGTRVAQHYTRRYPEAVRTLIIDGIAPPDVPLGPNAAINAQRVLDRLLARCSETADCAERFPTLADDLAALSERLREAAVELQIPHPVTGEAANLELNYAHLILALRMLSYTPETASLLPLIIDDAHSRNNFVPLASAALRVESELLGAIRIGMHNSVICAEDIPYVGEVDLDQLAATYIGTDQLSSLQTICEIWPRGPVDEDLHTPLTVDVPTLILSGEEDPITPPEYGAAVDRHLPNSLHLIGPGQGHGVLSRGCFPRLVSRFVDQGSLADLDTACVNQLTHLPFFLNLMGPSP